MAAAPRAELATEDLLIERPDLGPGCSTLIAKGDPIPPAFAGLPRRSRQPGPPPKRRRS
jgi:hypothetical protein